MKRAAAVEVISGDYCPVAFQAGNHILGEYV